MIGHQKRYSNIEELGILSRGRSKHRPRNDSALYNGPYPFIQTADITNSSLYITKYTQTYSEFGLAQSKLWDPGTLCIVNAGVGTGDNAILNFKACFPDSVIGFTPNKSKCNVFFLKYFLDSIKDNIRSITMGATQDNLSVAKLLTFKIPNYPIQIQDKIAAVLSAYDDLIENNTRRIALLERMAEELYKEWFVRMRFPGHAQTRFVKGIPEGWEVNTIEEFCTVARGSSPRPINDQAYFQNGDIPWIKIADATASKMFIYKTKEYVNNLGASFSRKLPKGSLIIATSGTLGFCILLGVEGCVHDGWMYLSGYKKNIKPSYMYYVINSLREHLNNLSYGAAIQNINTGILKKLPVFVPSKHVLDNFYTHVEAMHSVIFSIGEKNLLLRQTRDRLLTRLISGKLSVEDRDIAFPPSMLEDEMVQQAVAQMPAKSDVIIGAGKKNA